MATTKAKKDPMAVGGDLVLGALLAELAGGFILTTCLLNSGGNAFIAALTVMILVMAMSHLGSGHFNPAVTAAMWAVRQISTLKAAGYIVAQLLGAMLALIVVTQFISNTPVAEGMESLRVLAIPNLEEQWRPFLGETLGALIFGFGVAAAVLGRKTGIEAGFIVGGSLLLGLIVATLGSPAILNPAVALGMSAYHADNLWTILTFAVGPVIGMAGGAWLYKLLQWDVTGKKEIA